MNPYEEVPPEDEHRSYANKPKWQRALVIVAGSATHFVVAFVILLVTAMTLGFPTGDVTNELAAMDRTIDGELTPAARAGFEPNDRIVGVGGQPTDSWRTIRNYIREHGNQEAQFTVKREDTTRDVEVVLGTAIFDADGALVEYAPPGEDLRAPGAGETEAGFLGVSPKPEYEQEGLFGATGSAARETWGATKDSVRGIGETFNMVFGGELWRALTGSGERAIDEGPLGIVGAGRYASESVSRGQTLHLIGLIVGFTVFVGLMNLLPLPPLDGGHLAVLAYEGATGRTVDVRKLIPIAAAVISFFVLLFIAVLYLDLARPVKVPF